MAVNSNTIAFVTGGAQGIGRSFTEYLLANGAKVAIADLKTSVGATTKNELDAKYPGKIIFLPCDVTNETEFENAIKTTIGKFGYLNILINNAGIVDEADEGWVRMLRINAESVARGTKFGFKYMGKNNGGQGGTIVNIASITTFTPWEIIPVYSATKAFINQLCRCYGTMFHYELTSVKVISINPGVTDTPIVSNAADTLMDGRTKEAYDRKMKDFKMQKVDNMGRGLIIVLEKGNNGSLWLIENDEDPKEFKVEHKMM